MAMQSWNKIPWLAAAEIHVTSFIQLKCFISALHVNTTLNFVNDIDSLCQGSLPKSTIKVAL